MTFRIKPGQLNGIALDLGGTKLAAARVEAGKIVDLKACPTRPDASEAEQVEEMLRMARGLALTPTDRVGMAVTGRIDDAGTWRAVNVETLSDVSGANLADLAGVAFERPISVINDALSAMLAESRFGAGCGCDALAYVTVSTGVGGGLLLGGVPVTSPDGLAGHVGFSTSRLGVQACGCGRTGTVESIAAGRAIAAEAARSGHAVGTAKDVFDRWRDGEDWATEIVERSAAAIAELCGNLRAIAGVERVVIGGSIGLSDGYATLVEAHIAREPILFRPELVPASLGQDGVLLGALI